MKDVTLYKRGYLSLIDKDELELKKVQVGISFCKYLEKNEIMYDFCIKHPLVTGCDESEKYYKNCSSEIDTSYSICKHLFLKERKGDKKYLVVVDKEKQVDLKSLREKLECKKLEFASEDELYNSLHTTTGNISIFSIISDKDKKVELIVDKDLAAYPLLAFHPLYQCMTVFLREEAIFKFLKLFSRTAAILEIKKKRQ